MEADRQPEAQFDRRAGERVTVFEYPRCADVPEPALWPGWVEPGASAKSGSAPGADLERRLAEEARKAFEAGLQRGRQEGRQAEREAQAASERERVRLAAELIAKFAEERDRYLHVVEHEVVKLALAVAARILRREAQMDPLLLTGAVRVALGQLAATTEVRLRVPPAELELWTEAMALVPNLPIRPAVVAGEGMRAGESVLETELGSVDLGIRAQLAEIERGFFDRAGSAAPSGFGPSRSPGAERSA
ncbi:MAG TPA: FliH/SctL family protein [Terracidiphilus sp.]|nr:FliH/SctL family protein [Terracidiphilus sp.]